MRNSQKKLKGSPRLQKLLMKHSHVTKEKLWKRQKSCQTKKQTATLTPFSNTVL